MPTLDEVLNLWNREHGIAERKRQGSTSPPTTPAGKRNAEVVIIGMPIVSEVNCSRRALPATHNEWQACPPHFAHSSRQSRNVNAAGRPLR